MSWWGTAIAAVAKTAAYVSEIFSTRQKQAERESERAVGAELGGAAASKEGMGKADEVAKALAEQSTDEEIDAKAMAVAERRAARRKR